MTTQSTPTTPTRRLVDELDELHAHYAQAVNLALESGDTRTAEELAAAYDDDAIRLVAEREGKTHLLPLLRRGTPDNRLRRLVARLRRADSWTLWAFNPQASLDHRRKAS
jgi:hypothetical protein